MIQFTVVDYSIIGHGHFISLCICALWQWAWPGDLSGQWDSSKLYASRNLKCGF